MKFKCKEHGIIDQVEPCCIDAVLVSGEDQVREMLERRGMRTSTFRSKGVVNMLLAHNMTLLPDDLKILINDPNFLYIYANSTGSLAIQFKDVHHVNGNVYKEIHRTSNDEEMVTYSGSGTYWDCPVHGQAARVEPCCKYAKEFK